jgi:hypothetical protein
MAGEASAPGTARRRSLAGRRSRACSKPPRRRLPTLPRSFSIGYEPYAAQTQDAERRTQNAERRTWRDREFTSCSYFCLFSYSFFYSFRLFNKPPTSTSAPVDCRIRDTGGYTVRGWRVDILMIYHRLPVRWICSELLFLFLFGKSLFLLVLFATSINDRRRDG